MDTLEKFITANGKSCRDCKHFNPSNMDCLNPQFVRRVTNKFDFNTYEHYPIASAMRHIQGKCSPIAISFEKKQ